MLEGWTTLGFMAAQTKRARLGLMVGGIHYRQPGPVGQGRDDARRPVGRPGLARHRGRLERGRVARASGFPFPPLGERFEMLEETLQIAHGMWEGERGSRGGVRRPACSRPARLLNSPQSLSRPRVPIMIGGGGEKKTLRLVAQYADATNVFGTPEGVARKYAILAEHCAGDRPRPRRDRALDAPEHPGHARRRAAAPRRRPRSSTASATSSDAGAQHIIVGMRQLPDLDALELVGRDVIPQIRDL